MKLVVKCPICNSNELKTLKKHNFKATERELKNPTKLRSLIKEIIKLKDTANFIISSCQKCGFIFLNPTYSEQELNFLYSF